MPKTSIAAYSVRVKKRYTNDYLSTYDFNGTNSLFGFIQACLSEWKQYKANDQYKQLISLSHSKIIEDVFSGMLETGEYGYESKLYDIETKKVTHKRKTTEAEMLPFYFLFGFPEKATKGFLFLERFGAIGIRKMLTDLIQIEFAKIYPAFTIEIDPIIMEEVAEKYLNSGRLVKISFISYELPTDIAQYVAEGSSDDISYSELVVHAKKRGSIGLLDSLKGKLSKGKDLKKIFELKSFEFDTIKVKIEMDGNTRTISLEDLSNIRSYFSIEEEVEKSENGHPLFESIEAITLEIYRELKGRVLL